MSTTASTGNTLIWHDAQEGNYGLTCESAIIRHHKEGLVYICQTYGGEGSLRGGGYRWDLAVKLCDGDHIEDLRADGSWSDSVTRLEAACQGYDPERPILGWPEAIVAKVAASVGL